MLRRIRASLRMGWQRDRELFRRHRARWLVTGLLCLGLVVWAVAASAEGLTPEKAGRLESFSYGYGSFFGGYMDFTIAWEDDGQLYLSAIPGNGLTLSVHGPVPEEALAELSTLLADAGIFAWDGFEGSDEDILDGFSFGLVAEFEQGMLRGAGYERYPAGFEEGHAALSCYLVALAESILPAQISAPEDIREVTLAYEQDLSITVKPAVGRTPASATYRHGKTSEPHTGDALPPELLEDFFGRAMAHYNGNSERGNTGCAFALELEVNVHGVETTLSLSAETDHEEITCEQTPLEDMALALTGRYGGFLSEAYALEAFQNSLLYPELLLWDPEGVGEVRVNLQEMTVTMDGEVWQLPLVAVRDFAELAGAGDDPAFACLRKVNRLEELEDVAMDDPRSVRAWWQEQISRSETGWLFARVHGNAHFLYLYGGADLPEDWEAMRLALRKLMVWGKPLTPWNAGQLLSFSWRISENGATAFCDILPGSDGHLYLRANIDPGAATTAYGRLAPELLTELTATLAEQEIFPWNGFESWTNAGETPERAFRLEAVFEEGTLRASGEERFPEGFEAAQAGLEAALAPLVEAYAPWAPALVDIDEVELWFEEAGYALAVRAPLDGEPALVSFRGIGEDEDWHVVKEQAALSFLEAALDFYREHAPSGHTGADFQLYIGTPWLMHNPFAQLPEGRDGQREEDDPLKTMGLALAGQNGRLPLPSPM